jgi:hypothetical protein
VGQRFNNSIDDLLELIFQNKQGIDRDLCVAYLANTHKKLIFARKRIANLTKKVGTYKRRFIAGEYDCPLGTSWPDTLHIEIDFDHCISCLRSSLEHLAQLMNVVIPLNLPPRITKGEKHVTLRNVIEEIRNNPTLSRNEALSALSSYLNSETSKDWLIELQDLRITMYHDKSERLVHISTRNINRTPIDLRFLLPDGVAPSLKNELERDIIVYSRKAIKKVESILTVSFKKLSSYLV